jgi:hypothetical protein
VSEQQQLLLHSKAQQLQAKVASAGSGGDESHAQRLQLWSGVSAALDTGSLLAQAAAAASDPATAPSRLDQLAAAWLTSMLGQLPTGTDVCCLAVPSGGDGLLLCRLSEGALPLVLLLPPPAGPCDSQPR